MDLPTRASAIALLLLVANTTLAAQSGRLSRPRTGFELGIATPALLVRDANGARLHLGLSPVLGAVATWSLTPKVRSVVAIRLSTAALNGSEDDQKWDAGRASLASASIGLSGAVHERLSVSASAGPTWLSGPNDVIPFESSTSRLHWGGATGLSWRVSRARPIAAILSLEAFALGGATAVDPVAEAGWVRRMVIGMRYGA